MFIQKAFLKGMLSLVVAAIEIKLIKRYNHCPCLVCGLQSVQISRISP